MRRRLTQKRKKSNLVNSRRMRPSISRRRSRPNISRPSSRRRRQKRNYTRRRDGAIYGGNFFTNFFRKRNQLSVRQGQAKQSIKNQETDRKQSIKDQEEHLKKKYEDILIATTPAGCFEKWFLLTYWKDKIEPKLSSELLSYCVHQKHACEGMRNVHWWNKTSRFYNNENRWFNNLKKMTDEEAATFLLQQISIQVEPNIDRRNYKINSVPQAETFATVLQTIIERIQKGIYFTQQTFLTFEKIKLTSENDSSHFTEIINTQLENILCCLFSKKIQKLYLLYWSNLTTTYETLKSNFASPNVSSCFLQKCKIMLLVCLLLLSADEIDVDNYIKASKLDLSDCVEAIYILALHKDDSNQSGDLMKILENLRNVLNFSIEFNNKITNENFLIEFNKKITNKNDPEYPMFNVKPESKFDFSHIAQKLSFSFAFAFDFDFSLRGPADLAFKEKLYIFDEIKKTDKTKFNELQLFIQSVVVKIFQSSETKKIYIMTNVQNEKKNPTKTYKENKYPIGTILVKSNVRAEYNSLAVQEETLRISPLVINKLNGTTAGINGMFYFHNTDYHVNFKWLAYSPPPSSTQCQKNIKENASIYFVEYPKQFNANLYFQLLQNNKDTYNFVLLTEKKMSEITWPQENDLQSVFKCILTDGTTRTDVERALRKLQHVVDFFIQHLNLNDTDFYYTENFYTKIDAIKKHRSLTQVKHFLFDYKELTINLFKAVLPFMTCILTTPEKIHADIEKEPPYEDMSDANIPAPQLAPPAPATLSSAHPLAPATLAPTSNLPVTSQANVSEENTYGEKLIEKLIANSSNEESPYASIYPDASPSKNPVHSEIAAQRRLSTQSSYDEPNPTSAENSNVVAETNTGAAPTTNIYGDVGYVNSLDTLFSTPADKDKLNAAKESYFKKKCPPDTNVYKENIDFTLNAWCIKHDIQHPERVLALLRHRCDFNKGDFPVLSSADYKTLLEIMKTIKITYNSDEKKSIEEMLNENILTEKMLNDILYINLSSSEVGNVKKFKSLPLAQEFIDSSKLIGIRYVQDYLVQELRLLRENQESFNPNKNFLKDELAKMVMIYLILENEIQKENERLKEFIKIIQEKYYLFKEKCSTYDSFKNFLIQEKVTNTTKSLLKFSLEQYFGFTPINSVSIIFFEHIRKKCTAIKTGGRKTRQKPKHKKNNKKRKTRR